MLPADGYYPLTLMSGWKWHVEQQVIKAAEYECKQMIKQSKWF